MAKENIIKFYWCHRRAFLFWHGSLESHLSVKRNQEDLKKMIFKSSHWCLSVSKRMSQFAPVTHERPNFKTIWPHPDLQPALFVTKYSLLDIFQWLAAWWGGKKTFVLIKPNWSCFYSLPFNTQTLRDESIEILSTSRHYQRGNMTYFQHLTFRIYTKEGGPEDNYHWKRNKNTTENKISSKDPSRTDEVQNLTWCHMI